MSRMDDDTRCDCCGGDEDAMLTLVVEVLMAGKSEPEDLTLHVCLPCVVNQLIDPVRLQGLAGLVRSRRRLALQ